jgi:phenylalanyl-tRNA synthetase alpha chain
MPTKVSTYNQNPSFSRKQHDDDTPQGQSVAIMAATDATPKDLTHQILHALSEAEPLLSVEAFPQATFTDLKAALDRLGSREMVKYDTIDREEAILEPEGETIAANGSHEARVFEALRQAVEGLTVQELEKTIGDKNVTKVGQSKAFKEKWISRTKDGKFKTAVCPSLRLAHSSCAVN